MSDGPLFGASTYLLDGYGHAVAGSDTHPRFGPGDANPRKVVRLGQPRPTFGHIRPRLAAGARTRLRDPPGINVRARVEGHFPA